MSWYYKESNELISKQEGKAYILAVDGKKVSMGLDDKGGDINLWGRT